EDRGTREELDQLEVLGGQLDGETHLLEPVRLLRVHDDVPAAVLEHVLLPGVVLRGGVQSDDGTRRNAVRRSSDRRAVGAKTGDAKGTDLRATPRTDLRHGS